MTNVFVLNICPSETRNLREPDSLKFHFPQTLTQTNSLNPGESFSLALFTVQISCQCFVSSSGTCTTDTDGMAQAEWARIFQNKTKNLKQGDSWCLELDENIMPKYPNRGWKMCTRNTCGRSVCWTPNHLITIVIILYMLG